MIMMELQVRLGIKKVAHKILGTEPMISFVAWIYNYGS